MDHPDWTAASASPPIVISEAEAARKLCLAARTLQDLRLRGGGPIFVRLVGRRVGYRPADLDAWALARTASSTSAEGRP